MRVSTYYAEDGEEIYLTDYFTLTGNGVLTAKGAVLTEANVSGKLTAGNESNIGGLTVTETEAEKTLSYSNGSNSFKVMLKAAEHNVTLEARNHAAWTQVSAAGISINTTHGTTEITSTNLGDRTLPFFIWIDNQRIDLYLTADGTVKWAKSGSLPKDTLSGATAEIWTKDQVQDIT